MKWTIGCQANWRMSKRRRLSIVHFYLNFSNFLYKTTKSRKKCFLHLKKAETTLQTATITSLIWTTWKPILNHKVLKRPWNRIFQRTFLINQFLKENTLSHLQCVWLLLNPTNTNFLGFLMLFIKHKLSLRPIKTRMATKRKDQLRLLK